MATTEAELKTLMVAGLTGDAAAHRVLLDRLSGHLQQRRGGRDAAGKDNVRCECDQFRRLFAKAFGVAPAPSEVDTHVTADRPARFLQSSQERREARLSFHIVRREIHEHADAPHPLPLLRARRERPRRRRAAERG
jgi:hypothetical protein